MSPGLIVKLEAIAETTEIYAYHREISQALADRFAKALDASYSMIARNPTAYPARKKNYRHVMLRKFRYRVVYAVIGTEVVVFQVRHTSRKPSTKFGP